MARGRSICDIPNDESSCYMYYGTESQVVRDSTYTYDAVGNRTDLGATVQAGNRLTSFNGYTMTYDDDGNLLTKSGHGITQSFSWNGLGQLQSVTTNGATTYFGYDGLGRRVRKTSPSGTTTRYLHDGDNLLMQLDVNGARQLEFSYYPGIDHPNAVRNSTTGATYWYATSQPGNVVALVDQTNQVVKRYEYTPFGDSLSASGSFIQPFRFAGREFDSETGLYYNRARYYDPKVGRFISEDPIGLASGVNPYAYAENDPVNGRDPSGLEPCQWTVFHPAVGPHSNETYTELVIDCDVGFPNGQSANFGNPAARGGGAGSGGAGESSGGAGGVSVPKDPCNAYSTSSVLQGICQRVNGPRSEPANVCTARCLADKWLKDEKARGGTHSPLDVVTYLLPGHVTCYSNCGYAWYDFAYDFLIGTGQQQRPQSPQQPSTFLCFRGNAQYCGGNH